MNCYLGQCKIARESKIVKFKNNFWNICSELRINLKEHVTGYDYERSYLLDSGSPKCCVWWELGKATANMDFFYGYQNILGIKIILNIVISNVIFFFKAYLQAAGHFWFLHDLQNFLSTDLLRCGLYFRNTPQMRCWMCQMSRLRVKEACVLNVRAVLISKVAYYKNALNLWLKRFVTNDCLYSSALPPHQ